MRSRFVHLVATCLAAGCTAIAPPEPSDAPDPQVVRGGAHLAAPSYADALRTWRSAADVNAFIGARFEYDRSRAMLLSETQRQRGDRVPIHEPAVFFEAPRGICVDLARFAVETVRTIEPEAKPAFVMIEFEPVQLGGNTLRLHWLASYRRGGELYFFADSKRPGHLAGPYASVAAFMADYEAYRGRKVVRWRELESHERRVRERTPKRTLP